MKKAERINLLRQTREVTIKITALAMHYPSFTSVYIPRAPYDIGASKVGNILTPQHEAKEDPNREDNEERSLRRTKRAIKDYALCNKFELFATFTHSTDHYDLRKCKTKMSNWLKNQQKRNGKFSYLLVPEFHKDQKALHFHALIKGYAGELRRAYNPHTGRPLSKGGRPVYCIPSYRSGFTNVRHIEDTPESHTKVAFYVCKYITKDMPRLFVQNRYWASTDLEVPRMEYSPDLARYATEAADRVYANEFGTTLFFINSQLTTPPDRTAVADVTELELLQTVDEP